MKNDGTYFVTTAVVFVVTTFIAALCWQSNLDRDAKLVCTEKYSADTCANLFR